MSDRAAEVLMLGLLLILPASALLARRLPLGRTLLMAGAWAGIFLVGLVIAGQRDRLGGLLHGSQVEGVETRIPMAADGHFWADVAVDGVRRHMLIDSGATTTALSVATAQAANLDVDSVFPVVLETANGQVSAQTATARRIAIGGVTWRDVHVVVSPTFGSTDVVGMNMLSELYAWRVDHGTLILTPSRSSS